MSAANGRLKLGLGGKWVDCEIGVIGHGPNYYVRLHTKHGTVDLAGRREHLRYALWAVVSILDGRQPDPLVTLPLDERGSVTNDLVTELAGSRRPGVTNDPTPAEVIEHFRRSPDLSPMAADVEHALAHLVYQDQAAQDVEIVLAAVPADQLIDAQGRAVYGAQARIAAALGIPNAGGYRPRILAVLAELARQKTTTTANKPGNQHKTA